MSRETKVVILDDLDRTEGAATVKFSINDKKYEIDLSEANQVKFQKALQPYLAVARNKNRQPRKP